MKIARVGVVTSKSVFQLHGVDEAEQVVLRRKLPAFAGTAMFEYLRIYLIGTRSRASGEPRRVA